MFKLVGGGVVIVVEINVGHRQVFYMAMLKLDIRTRSSLARAVSDNNNKCVSTPELTRQDSHAKNDGVTFHP